MDQITNILNDSLFNYFNKLKVFGYINYQQVYTLILLIHIHELIESNSSYITEFDYKVLENTLYKIYGSSCLIPYPQYLVEDESSFLKKFFRSDTNYNLRKTENSNFRLVSK